MTATPSSVRTSVVRLLAPVLLVVALAGCAGSTGEAAGTPTPSASTSGPCTDVNVVVNFGTLDHDAITACAPAGVATAVLKSADLSTAGTTDYGDAVVCRVDDLPAPADESCATLPSAAYWAVWVKSGPDAKWDYAQEGVATLQLTAGQSLGLVYTQGTDTTPPQD